MEWKFTGSRPVYQQIMEQLRGAVLSGEFPPGCRVPSVRDLAMAAGVNPNTMQRALAELEREGILTGCGTAGRNVTQNAAVLQQLHDQAVEAAIQASASRFRELGLTMAEAARLLLQLEGNKED